MSITSDALYLQEVHSYVNLETQLLQKAKEPQSATAKTNREKKKQEIGGVFKFVVRLAENSKSYSFHSLCLFHILKETYMTYQYLNGLKSGKSLKAFILILK